MFGKIFLISFLVRFCPHLPLMYPQALHTNRINLSPFTKDFRVGGALIETNSIYLRVFLRENLLILNILLGCSLYYMMGTAGLILDMRYITNPGARNADAAQTSLATV
jgi:hypothetical protein